MNLVRGNQKDIIALHLIDEVALNIAENTRKVFM